MEHALPRTWSLCMTSENHGTVGPAGCTFSHAPEKHERVLVVEAPAGTQAPVAEFKGYVDGQPAVTWFDRDNMPRVGTKLFAGNAATDVEMDAGFLQWLHDRMCFVHGENVNVDYMHKLRAIIASVPSGRDTPNVASVATPQATREVAAQAGQVAVPKVEYKAVGSFLFTGWAYEATSSDDPRGITLYRPAKASTSGERQEGGQS